MALARWGPRRRTAKASAATRYPLVCETQRRSRRGRYALAGWKNWRRDALLSTARWAEAPLSNARQEAQ
eukprot:7812563-Alexandrium_andersonii.AAC.1